MHEISKIIFKVLISGYESVVVEKAVEGWLEAIVGETC